MTEKQRTQYIEDRLGRGAFGMACPCGGYADIQNDLTEKEILIIQQEKGYCGRFHRCCARAFKCRVCETRLLANAEAPEAA